LNNRNQVSKLRIDTIQRTARAVKGKIIKISGRGGKPALMAFCPLYTGLLIPSIPLVVGLNVMMSIGKVRGTYTST